MMEQLQSRILISAASFESLYEELRASIQEAGARLIAILREGNFKVEDVALALQKAYLTSQEHEVILLGADRFSDVVQNKLLKVIEEPPPNKSFILIFRSKASVLPTIRSRLPIIHLDRDRAKVESGLDMSRLDIASVYEFLQKHKSLSADEARVLLEAIVKEALSSGEFVLDEHALDIFSKAIRTLNLGSPPSFVLNSVLLELLAKRKRRIR